MRALATARTNGRAPTRWSVLFSSKRQNWSTPDDLFNELDQEFHFTLDACAAPTNAKVKRYFTVRENGLIRDWGCERVWCNPPYHELKDWLAKGAASARRGALCVFLIPARTDTKAWHDYVMHASETRFLRGRLRFGNAKNTAPFPSAIVIFRPPIRPPVQLNLWETTS